MNGFLNIVKTKGPTSHDVVLEIRRILDEKKVGHLGTLDPMARGVLPVAVGNYTRLSEYLMNEDKEYLAEFMFGITTDTGDMDGQVLAMQDCSDVTASDVKRQLSKFLGKIKQVPPNFSAVHVDGNRLHNLARKGITVDVPSRDVEIHSFEILHFSPGVCGQGIFSIHVGSGTYVRSLARDLGEELGCGCTVSYLLRTRVGNFHLKDAVLTDTLKRALSYQSLDRFFVDPKDALWRFPFVEIRPESVELVRHGAPLEVTDFVDPEGTLELMRKSMHESEDERPIFICTYEDPSSNAYKIACVLSLDWVDKLSFRMKYEKVLVQGSDVR